MSPRAFQTILVAPMGIKDRLELESRVLAAALKQSFERGDTAGVSLAHRQIFLLLRAAQEVKDDSTSSGAAPQLSMGRSAADRTNARLPAKGIKVKTRKGKKRVMPDIVWTEDEGDEDEDEDASDDAHESDDAAERPAASQEPVTAEAISSEEEQEPASAKESDSAEPREPTIKPVPTPFVKQPKPAASLKPLSEAISAIGADESDAADIQAESANEVESAESADSANNNEDIGSNGAEVFSMQPASPAGSHQSAAEVMESEADLSQVEEVPTRTRTFAERELEDETISAEEAKATELLESLKATGDRIKQLSADESLEIDDDKPEFDAYEILHVEQIATFEEIHRNFLYLVRRLMFALKKVKRKQRRLILAELQDLWIAHDILSDPVTRTDYDFRILGLRGAPDIIIHTAPEDREQAQSSTRTPLRIGELMQCAGLLEPTELEIAADMHKAMPEMLFGAFLVKQGFIEEGDLEQVLMGQRLLKNGNITVGHFQMAMKKWREETVPIEETAVTEGLVSQPEMDRIIASGSLDTHAGVPAVGGMQPLRPMINAEEVAKRNFSLGNAVPSWKDQLDWSAPEPVPKRQETYDSRPRVFEPPPEIEDIKPDPETRKKSGKKTLRVLIEGISSEGESKHTSIFSYQESEKAKESARENANTGDIAVPDTADVTGERDTISGDLAGFNTSDQVPAFGADQRALAEESTAVQGSGETVEEPRGRADTGPITMDPGFDMNSLLPQKQEKEEYSLEEYDDEDEEIEDIDYFGSGSDDDDEREDESAISTASGDESSDVSSDESDSTDDDVSVQEDQTANKTGQRDDTVTGARIEAVTSETQSDSNPDQNERARKKNRLPTKSGDWQLVYKLEADQDKDDDNAPTAANEPSEPGSPG